MGNHAVAELPQPVSQWVMFQIDQQMPGTIAQYDEKVLQLYSIKVCPICPKYSNNVWCARLIGSPLGPADPLAAKRRVEAAILADAQCDQCSAANVGLTQE